MALNKWMHPRNPYRNAKPDFKSLAEQFPDFRKHTSTDSKGKVHLDFKNSECLRALTSVLLEKDFQLQLDMPPDRLVPTVPLRLNYILWLEDILNGMSGDSSSPEDVYGIDIGTGASCVYPLLGARKNRWSFLATEADATNFEYAQKNVLSNGLGDSISVRHVGDDSMLCDIFQHPDVRNSFHFCMCNPPFFGSNMEAWGMLNNRTDERPEPMSASTASPQESIVPGGEVQFVKNMIADSVVLKNKIKVYSTMLGKKASLSILKQELRQSGVSHIGSTEFCQGRTMRWGLAWTYGDSISFPKAPSKGSPAKTKCGIIHKIPTTLVHYPDLTYTVEALSEVVLSLCEKLQMTVKEKLCCTSWCSWCVSAHDNTWSHQRRKRREQKRIHPQTNTATGSPKRVCPEEDKSPRLVTTTSLDQPMSASVDTTDTQSHSEPNVREVEKATKQEEELSQPDTESHSELNAGSSKKDKNVSNPGGELGRPPLLQAQVIVRQDADVVLLELKCEADQNREILHQVLQFFKNQLR